MDSLDNYWVENIRNEFLNEIFKIFPYFASDAFYIIIIATCYWRSNNKKLFIDLGFLVCISTLINITLKNTFSLPRPPQILHLVPYHDDFGFPSGDVQVSLVFWGWIYMATNIKMLRVFAICLVAGISLSRVYLGVHSILDVIGGLFFGTCILYSYNTDYMRNISNLWLNKYLKSYWYIVTIVFLIYWGS